ncbi:MAG: tripartite tricarboxylate transporter TctB family protein [Tropicimonas sp.]|uniref:tripartite tricarboxylate transporter TctB family protein n=1 Tax=Tropicimonas sp. TaxID=2067044 RepID=UPI003A8462C0
MGPEEEPRQSGLNMLRVPSTAVDLVLGAGIFAACIWYYLQADGLAAPLNEIDPGPAAFPLLLALTTLLSLVGIGISAIIRALGAGPEIFVTIKRPLAVLVMICLFGAVAVWLEDLGTIPSILILSVVSMLACGERRPVHLIGVPLALTGFIYGVFVLGLAVNLP